jgi:hypothetical protein
MSTAATQSEADILSRIVAPGKATLPSQTAEMILALDFPEVDRVRMSHLAEKARSGTLTAEEQLELDAYERVGHFLSLLKSKARISLKQSARTE